MIKDAFLSCIYKCEHQAQSLLQAVLINVVFAVNALCTTVMCIHVFRIFYIKYCIEGFSKSLDPRYRVLASGGYKKMSSILADQ